MMINIVLFDEESIIRIGKKAMEFFSDYSGLRTTENTIWLNGMYLRFYPKLITVNSFNPTVFPHEHLIKCLSYILNGEEVFVSAARQNSKYIDSVNQATCFDSFFVNCKV